MARDILMSADSADILANFGNYPQTQRKKFRDRKKIA
jgi:hypothetical protein